MSDFHVRALLGTTFGARLVHVRVRVIAEFCFARPWTIVLVLVSLRSKSELHGNASFVLHALESGTGGHIVGSADRTTAR